MTENKIDIVNTDEDAFKRVLNELSKEEITNLMLGLKKELAKDYESFTFEFENIPFERIRRITGYLVGTLDRFNNAKRAEVEHREKHNMESYN